MRKVLSVTADKHVASPFALPPNGESWNYVDGGPKRISGFQEQIWNHWEDYWRWIGDMRKGAELIVLDLGDPIEGKHHGIVELLTSRIDEQERMHICAMQEALYLAKFNPKRDKLIYLDGTPAHCGEGNSSTERIARALLKTERLDGDVVRPYFLARINGGDLFDAAHKGFKLGSREWTKTNSMRAYLTSRWFTSLKNKQPMPRHILRAHFHQFGHASVEDDAGMAVSEAWAMPAWKIKDEYIYEFAPEAMSNIGGLAFTIDNNGHSTAHKLLMQVVQDEVQEL